MFFLVERRVVGLEASRSTRLTPQRHRSLGVCVLYRVLCVVYCVLCVKYCVLFVVYCVLCVVKYIVHGVCVVLVLHIVF